MFKAERFSGKPENDFLFDENALTFEGDILANVGFDRIDLRLPLLISEEHLTCSWFLDYCPPLQELY